MEKIAIGITERGDAGLDFTWFDKLSTVTGVVLITKSANKNFRDKVMEAYNNGYKNIVIHATCTGLGGTVYEPNVPEWQTQIENVKALIADGFPIPNIVIRVDPIIPTEDCLNKTDKVLTAIENLQKEYNHKFRIRISIVDMYQHVRRRFYDANITVPYGGASMSPSYMDVFTVATMLGKHTALQYESCAEGALAQRTSFVTPSGCISDAELDLFGITENNFALNPQNRYGCHCLSCKTELLTRKNPCPHNCLYCYWKN